MEIQEKITKQVIKEKEDSLRHLIIESLKQKGFEFKNDEELKEFLKEKCIVKDDLDNKTRTYLVNDIPFLIEYYEMTFKQQSLDMGVRMDFLLHKYEIL